MRSSRSHGARLGLVTTAGHGDVMFLMRGSGRTSGLPPDELLDVPSTNKPVPLVHAAAHLRESAERVDVDGDVVVPISTRTPSGAAARSLSRGRRRGRLHQLPVVDQESRSRAKRAREI
jgi:hypothetical protein